MYRKDVLLRRTNIKKKKKNTFNIPDYITNLQEADLETELKESILYIHGYSLERETNHQCKRVATYISNTINPGKGHCNKIMESFCEF